MKALIILAIGSLLSVGAQASQEAEKADRALQLAKRANGYLRSAINEDEVSGNRGGDLFGSFGFNRCVIEKAVVTLDDSKFSVTTPCGERYQITVTGLISNQGDSITSAKVELR